MGIDHAVSLVAPLEGGKEETLDRIRFLATAVSEVH